tara:strand:- start:45121 stop:45309 length:189 start_codon:yes stop_codon:yes gene_type:complete
MFNNDFSTNEVMTGLTAEGDARTLRKQAAEVPECVRSTVAPTWVFIGKYAMPHSEHLIPFQD